MDDEDVVEAIDATVKAVADPDRSVALAAIRDRLALELVMADGSALASVAKQLRETLRELDQVQPSEVSKRDQLAAARAARLASVSDPAAKRGKRGA